METEIARDAFALLTGVVDRLGDDDWVKRSNLEGWTVRDVVGHVTGSVAKARHLALDEPINQLRSEPCDWYSDHAAADLTRECEATVAALADADPGGLREMRGSQLPLAAAVSFPIVDAVVHAWDIERSLGRALEVPPGLLDYASQLTDRVGSAPNPNFAPPLEPAPDATPTERLMARLGRAAS